jgi:hypothetical protein
MPTRGSNATVAAANLPRLARRIGNRAGDRSGEPKLTTYPLEKQIMIQLIFLACLLIVQDDTAPKTSNLVLASRAQATIDETEKHKKYLQRNLENEEKRLEAAKKAKINPKGGNSSSTSKSGNREIIRFQFSSKEAREESVKELTEKVDQLTKDIKSIDEREAVVFPSLSARMQVGDFGGFFGNKIYVLQIIDSKTMRAELRDPRVGTNKNINVMVRGLPTSGMVDNQAFACETVFEVTGTETYNTAIGGTQTVFVLKPLDTDPIVELIQKPKK